jgi:hypothetical protein
MWLYHVRIMLCVFVPSGNVSGLIDRGSGIVGVKLDDPRSEEGTILVHFEGNRFGALNLQRWADRVSCAADRLLAKYPTVASAVLMTSDLREVGSFDPDTGSVCLYDEDSRALVGNWLGSEVELTEYSSSALRDKEIENNILSAAGGNPVLARQMRKLLRRS